MKTVENYITQSIHAKLIMDELRNKILPLAEKHNIVVKGILFDDYCIQAENDEDLLNFMKELHEGR